MPAPASASGPSRWISLRYRLEHALLSMAESVVPLMPYRLLGWTASILGNLAWLLDARGRNVIRANLRMALGDTLDTPRLRHIERSNYRVFARTFLQLFWGSRLNVDNWDRHFVMTYDSPLALAAATQGPCVFATAHFGNFEWLSLGRSLRCGPMMIIAQDFKNPPLTAIFRRLRSLGGQTIIPQEGAMLRLFRHLKKGGTVAALVDLNNPPDQSATVIQRFGRWSSISVLHVALAARAGVPLVPTLALPRADGRWELRFMDPLCVDAEGSLQQSAQLCWDVMEPVIREFPEQWMWLYKHWRYLPPDAESMGYPPYANRSRAFDNLYNKHVPTI